ncbi:hypothetical protein DOTSEDRAFT_79636 [Dothistroma septosporum NZE10]|uniref:F-box/LRR-repeat protein 15/At3g58940/PEG3-like LRR domain-containing protein n=1 Tax=Dothistroma septosporum (strain NZE10 / CBS 128990) TaxID=675120 RepID=N1PQM9_DOTSN|nr:hypothetical protein DOTSEDRAFT_79636 [Dothistroma septosporum NZE10]
MATTTSDLPDELLGDDRYTLRSLSLVSRRLYAVTEPVLYRNIFFRHAKHCIRLSTSLSASAQRAAAVQSIEARCAIDSSNMDATQGFTKLSDILLTTKNTKSLTVEDGGSHHATFGQSSAPWESLIEQLVGIFWSVYRNQEMAVIPLKQLKQLNLHWSGSGNRHWHCRGQFAIIFALPTLEDLTLSFAFIPEDAVESVAHLPQMPLKRLELVECNMTKSGLAGVLSRPRALEHLHIACSAQTLANRSQGETNHHQDEYFSVCAPNLSELLQALRLQRQSLNTLSITPHRTRPGLWVDDDPFHVDYDGNVPHADTRISRQDNTDDVFDISLGTRLVEICRGIISITSLRKVEVTLDVDRDGPTYQLIGMIVRRATEDLIVNGVAVTVYERELHLDGLPSCLYGATKPRLALVYDSRQGGWLKALD